MKIIDLLYMLSAFVFPVFYLPQIRKLLRDHSGSIHYSYQKASAHLLLRVLAMAYAIGHGLTEMAVVVGLDMVARSIELGIAYFVHDKHTRANVPPKIEPTEVSDAELLPEQATS
jgi:hypothetical protein